MKMDDKHLRRLSGRQRKASYKLLELRKESGKCLEINTSSKNTNLLSTVCQSVQRKRIHDNTKPANEGSTKKARLTANGVQTNKKNSIEASDNRLTNKGRPKVTEGTKTLKSQRQAKTYKSNHSKQGVASKTGKTNSKAKNGIPTRLSSEATKSKSTTSSKRQSSRLEHPESHECDSAKASTFSKPVIEHKQIINNRMTRTSNSKRKANLTKTDMGRESINKGKHLLQEITPMTPTRKSPITRPFEDYGSVEMTIDNNLAKKMDESSASKAISPYPALVQGVDKTPVDLSASSSRNSLCDKEFPNTVTNISESRSYLLKFDNFNENIKSQSLNTGRSVSMEMESLVENDYNDNQMKNNETKNDDEITQIDNKITQVSNEITQINNEVTQRDNNDTQKECESTQKENKYIQKGNEITQKDSKCTQKNEDESQGDHDVMYYTQLEDADSDDGLPRKPEVKRSFQCEECGKVLSGLSSFTKHSLLHSGHRPYVCEVCGLSFMLKEYLNRHMVCHNGLRKFECLVCDKKFTRLSNLTAHKLVHSDERLFSCSECHKTFKTSTSRDLHMRYHSDKMFTCNQCGKRFITEHLLEKHYNLHKNYKPYGCDVCGKAFAYNQSLQEHLMRHNGMKPVPCTLCQKRFNNKRELTAHMRYHEVKTDYPCTLCNLYYESKLSLQKHVSKTHKQVDVCDVCQKTFTNKRQYKSHMFHEHRNKGHSANSTKILPEQMAKSKKVMCTLCERIFNNKSGLSKHLVSKHGFSQDEMKAQLQVREKVRLVRSEPYNQWEEIDQPTDTSIITDNHETDTNLDDKDFKVYYKDDEMSVFVKMGKGQPSQKLYERSGILGKSDNKGIDDHNIESFQTVGANVTFVGDGSLVNEGTIRQQQRKKDDINFVTNAESNYKYTSNVTVKNKDITNGIQTVLGIPGTRSTLSDPGASGKEAFHMDNETQERNYGLDYGLRSRSNLSTDQMNPVNLDAAKPSISQMDDVAHSTVDSDQITRSGLRISETNFHNATISTFGSIDQLADTNNQDNVYLVVSESGDLNQNQMRENQGILSLTDNSEIVNITEDGDHIILIVDKKNEETGHAISVKDFTGNQTIMINGEQYEIVSTKESANMVEDVLSANGSEAMDVDTSSNYVDIADVNSHSGNLSQVYYGEQNMSLNINTVGNSNDESRGFKARLKQEESKAIESRAVRNSVHEGKDLKSILQHAQGIDLDRGAGDNIKDGKGGLGPSSGSYQGLPENYQVIEMAVPDSLTLEADAGGLIESEIHEERVENGDIDDTAKETIDSAVDVLEQLKQFADLVAMSQDSLGTVQENTVTVGSSQNNLHIIQENKDSVPSKQNTKQNDRYSSGASMGGIERAVENGINITGSDNITEGFEGKRPYFDTMGTDIDMVKASMCMYENQLTSVVDNEQDLIETEKVNVVPLEVVQESEKVKVVPVQGVGEDIEFKKQIFDSIDSAASDLTGEIRGDIAIDGINTEESGSKQVLAGNLAREFSDGIVKPNMHTESTKAISMNPANSISSIIDGPIFLRDVHTKPSSNKDANIGMNIKDHSSSCNLNIQGIEPPVPKTNSVDEFNRFEKALKEKGREFRNTEDYGAYLDKMMNSLQKAKQELGKF